MAKELAKVEAPAGSEVEALAALPRDLAIVKIQEDSMMAMAAAHPRDYVAILADIKQQITAYKSFAQGIMYTKPVGGGKHVTGLSIRAAEAIKLAFGHCSVVTDVSIIDEHNVKVSATFTDFQRGNKWTDGGVLSKFYQAAGGGGTVRHKEDRFYNVVVKAEISKRVREVILRSVPPGLKSEIEKAALEALGEFMDDGALQSLMEGFAEKNVSVEQIEKAIGKRRENFLTDDRTKLLGLWNAVKDGESSVNEVFGGEEPAPLEDGESATQALADEVAPKKKAASRPAPIADDADLISIALALESEEGETFAIEGTILVVNPFAKFHIIIVTDGVKKIEVKRWTQGKAPEWCVKGKDVRLPVKVKMHDNRKQFEIVEDARAKP